MTIRHTVRTVSRRSTLAGLGAGSLALATTGRSIAAQDATPAMATHPVVGAWVSMNPGDPPSASPVSFTADGIMTVAYAPSYIDPELGVVLQGPALGTWEPTGERSFRFTFVQALSSVDGTYLGTFTLNGFPEVSEDGLSFVDEGTLASVTLRDANNVVIFEAGGEGEAPMTPPVHARRLRVGDPGIPDATAAAAATASPVP